MRILDFASSGPHRGVTMDFGTLLFGGPHRGRGVVHLAKENVKDLFGTDNKYVHIEGWST